jgi:hypothetical protein
MLQRRISHTYAKAVELNVTIEPCVVQQARPVASKLILLHGNMFTLREMRLLRNNCKTACYQATSQVFAFLCSQGSLDNDDFFR